MTVCVMFTKIYCCLKIGGILNLFFIATVENKNKTLYHLQHPIDLESLVFPKKMLF